MDLQSLRTTENQAMGQRPRQSLSPLEVHSTRRSSVAGCLVSPVLALLAPKPQTLENSSLFSCSHPMWTAARAVVRTCAALLSRSATAVWSRAPPPSIKPGLISAPACVISDKKRLKRCQSQKRRMYYGNLFRIADGQ